MFCGSRLFFFSGQGGKMALLIVKVADPWSGLSNTVPPCGVLGDVSRRTHLKDRPVSPSCKLTPLRALVKSLSVSNDTLDI